MINKILVFFIELINWIRARKYRYELIGKPYFWGPPDSRESFERYEAFLRACGISRRHAIHRGSIPRSL